MGSLIQVFCALVLVILQVDQAFSVKNIPQFINYDVLKDRYIFEAEFEVGDVLGKVEAFDPDGTAVQFFIDGKGFQYFQINRDTGEVSLKSRLDFESEREIDVIIRVIDEDLQVNRMETSVYVKDSNDLVPTFDKTNIFATLDEDTKPGKIISTISVSDKDRTNELLKVRCLGDTDDHRDACDKFGLSFFAANTSNLGWFGELVLQKPLDYEKRISYAIILIASDGKFDISNEIHIEVKDINDSPPVWTRINSVNINEELPIASPVTTVTARDGDVTEPRKIYYEIMPGTPEFAIDSGTGDISIAQVIDFDSPSHERNVPFNVKVKAYEVLSDNPLTLGSDAVTTSTAVVSINVRDIDDNSPKFNKDKYTAYIKENIVSGANVPGLQMTITDIDSATYLYNTFDLKTLQFQDIFAIAPTSGKANAGATLFVVNSEKIDFEKGPRQYVINAEAPENNVSPALTGYATITIIVEDVNDQSPEFDRDTYTRSVPETSDSTTLVIDLDATDSELGDFGTAGIRYRLYGNQQNHFAIDERTGAITVGTCATPGIFPCIDFERKSRYVLTVSATDNKGNIDTGRTRSVQVIVTITDENDNLPKLEDEYLAFIYEEQTVPVQPLIVKAEDPDTVGGQLNYEIVGDPKIISNWQITNKNDALGDRIGEITAIRPVLFSDATDPTTGALTFDVLAKDQKDTVRSKVTIRIIDINNNAPEFSSQLYEESIPESTVGEIFIITVTATDGDAPTTGNGIIDFSIVSGAQGKFTVKKSTTKRGEADVYTTPDALFNYDTKNKYEMKLRARDQGTPVSKEGETTVIVNIIDINNNAPEITPTTVSIAVPENEPKNGQVHKVNANDPDNNADLRYYMTPTTAQTPNGAKVDISVYNYAELFRIEEETGIVRVNKGLNRESTSFIINTLTVVDVAATPHQTGTGALFITITEVNDQDPAFEKSLYEIAINEELNINYFVQNLICRDDDDNIASYQLFQNEPRTPSYFTIVDTSGSLIVNNRIDFEQLEKIKLTAICFDDGTPQRSGSTQIEITVKNINDNSPAFEKPLYTVEILETRPGEDHAGDVLETVSANDIDKGDFGIVRYRLDPSEKNFKIDEVSGKITVMPDIEFDREQMASYGFQVIAFDSPNTPSKRRETSVPVYLTIKDINDNCPIFSDQIYDGSIPESAKTGTDVIDVLATDKDAGINKRIAFTVTPGSFNPPEGANFFSIGQRSGRIYTLGTLIGKYGLYKFSVTATDTNGELPEQCSTQVQIEATVSQSQNYAPRWVRPPQRDFVIYVLESQYEGMLVYDSKAEDLDPGLAGVVDYYFVDGSQNVAATKEFRINQVTGIIRAEVEFDREDVDTYFLTLVAQDQGVTKASSQITLIVVIMDVDDNDPVFGAKSGQVEPLVLPEFDFEEGQQPNAGGRKVGQCKATDKDSDHDHNKIFYEVLSADDKVRDMVRVDRDTCEIFVIKEIDYEMTPTLEFSIFAFNERNDDSVRRHRREVNPSIQPVIIRIKDKNDNPPAFTASEYFTCAAVDAPFKSSILDLDAHDLEQADVELKYKLSGNSASSFEIDKSGIIHNMISFASETNRIFDFTAVVDDGDMTGSAKVNVFITTESNQVMMKVNRPSSDVLRIQKTYEDYFKQFSNDVVHVCVDIKNHITTEGKISNSESDVYVAVVGADRTSGRYTIWSQNELYARMRSDRSDHREKYNTELFVSEISKVDDDEFSLDEDVVLVILIIAILLIAFAILLFILACYCIWAKKKKKVKKVKAQRHTIVQTTPARQDESFNNPVYHNQGYVYEEEYSTVSRSRKDVGPIAPVVIPAPENLEPLSTFAPARLEPESPPEIPEPFIETEVLTTEDELAPEVPQKLMEPEYEDRIETVLVDDHQVGDNEDLPLPPPVADDEIETEIRDTPPPSPPPQTLY